MLFQQFKLLPRTATNIEYGVIAIPFYQGDDPAAYWTNGRGEERIVDPSGVMIFLHLSLLTL
jgi:hypothetical protein